jgi:hypothetical protein
VIEEEESSRPGSSSELSNYLNEQQVEEYISNLKQKALHVLPPKTPSEKSFSAESLSQLEDKIVQKIMIEVK